jgi:hypothetical protein
MTDELTVCGACGYPHRGPGCENPGCRANPRISAEVLAAWDVRDERASAERAERAMLDRARSLSFGCAS